MELTIILMDVFFIGLLAWCSYTDWKTRTVSNLPVVLLLCLSLAHMVLLPPEVSPWWQYLARLLVAIPFFIAWMGNSMGAGDVKLVMTIALYLGLFNTLISFALMMPLLSVIMLRSWLKNKTVVCRIPFAPVLAFGAASAVVLGYFYTLVQL